jgi:protein associated with RNAse G/E
MSELTVYKLDETGAEVWQYPARILELTTHSIQLEANFNRDLVDMGFTQFRRGDRFVETFYTDRWYNVFAVYEGDTESLKGWYCNICRPAIVTPTAVRCEDLALDMWVGADGNFQLLDEDEFAALDLSAAERRQSWAAVSKLIALAEQDLLPR